MMFGDESNDGILGIQQQAFTFFYLFSSWIHLEDLAAQGHTFRHISLSVTIGEPKGSC